LLQPPGARQSGCGAGPRGSGLDGVWAAGTVGAAGPGPRRRTGAF
jgi:hypothetical protein